MCGLLARGIGVRRSSLLPHHVRLRRRKLCSTSTSLQNWSIVANMASETEVAGSRLAKELGPLPGQFISLRGSVGAGKSVFARGFIRQATGQPELRVQSPTFLLEQEYMDQSRNFYLHHFDLYRFIPEMTLVDAKALDWTKSIKSGVCLVEWPERIKNRALLPTFWIDVQIEFDKSQDAARTITVVHNVTSI